MDELRNIRFDSKNIATTEAYTASIRGLNEEQARYVLSKRYVSEADQNDLLIKAGIIKANGSVEASELSRQLVLQGLRKEQAEALIEQEAGNKAITSNTILTKEQTSAILAQAEARKLLSVEQRQNIANDLQESTSSMAEASTETVQAASELIESSVKLGSASSILSRGFSQLGKGIGSLLSVFVSSPVTFIATLTGGIIGLTYVIGKFQDTAKNAADSASDFANSMSSINSEYNSQKQSLNDYIEQYQNLREQLIAAKGNEEETYNIKSQLLDLQKQLNEIYSDEYDKVNLVTDAYRDQTDTLEKNAKKKAENYLNENQDDIEEAKDKMTSEYTYELGNLNYGLNINAEYGINLHDQIEKIAKDNGIEWDKNKGFVFKGTAEEAHEAINNFMSDIRALKDEQKDLVSDGIVSQSDLDALEDNYTGFFSEMSKQLGYADSIIDGYQETYETAQLAEIATDKDLSKGYNEAVDAVEAYNEAVLKSEDPYNDENVKKAWDNLQTVKQGIKDNEEEWGQYSNITDNVFAEANDDIYSFYQKMQNDDSISKLANDLKGLSNTDLESMANDDVEDSFDKLCESASDYGLEIQDVIDLLIKLGLIQGKLTEESQNPDEITVLDAKSLVQGADGTEGLISEIQLLQEVLADTGNISQETYEKLLSCSKDYATAIRTENGRITLNTTKLKQVAKQRQLDTKATIKETLAIKKQEWLQWKNKIENYNGTLLDSIETKYNDIDALQAEIAQYELLVNSLDSATSAFERFKAAQSTSNQDMYDTAQDAFNVLKEYSSDSSSENYGKYNTDEFQEAAMLLMDSETYKKALNAKDLTEYQKVVNGFVKSISPLFDENNAKSASKLFDEVDKIIASGDTPVADQDWADRLGISKEAFNALKQLANLYDYNNKEVFESFPLDKLDDYQEKLSNVVAEKKALNEIEDKSSNEYLKQEQSLKQAEEKYNSFLQNNAETMTNAFANYSKTNGLINGENVTFADYVKEQFDFEDTDIQGSTLALIDQADKLQSKLNTITSDKNAQKQFAEYDQLQGLISILNALGYQYEQTADNKKKFESESEQSAKSKETNVLQDRIAEYQKIQKQIEIANRNLLRTETGSEEFNAISSDISNLQAQLDVLREPITIEINANIADLEANIQKVTEEKNQFAKSNAGLDGTMFYTSQMNSYNEQIERDTATKNELEKTLEVIVEDEEALGKLNELDSFEIAGKEFAVTAIDSATSVVESVNSMKIADKNFKITASVGVSQVSGSTNLGNLGGLGGSVSKVVSDAASKVSGFGGAYGTANISGHAYADGNIGTNQELKNVMVGEVAPEMVVDPHSGEYTIYQNPTMLDKLPKNAIIFNGKQTEEILKNGMTTSFGKAYVNGNVTGKAFGNGNGTKVNLPNFNDVKSNNNAIKNAGKEASDAIEDTTEDVKEASDAIEDTTEDVKEASEEIFDWIERRIQKFQRLFDKWLNQAETAITSGFITKYYKKATSSLTSLLKTQAKAYTRYMEEANKVGLPEEYAKKVRNGTID